MLPKSVVGACANGKRESAVIVSAIAMHHIYCDVKKSVILEEAVRLNLGGLFLFGKPGRVVVEGVRCNVIRYERRLRGLHWQKIQVMGHCDSPVGADASSPMKHGKQHSDHPVARVFPVGMGLRECESVEEMNALLHAAQLVEICTAINRPFGAPRSFQ